MMRSGCFGVVLLVLVAGAPACERSEAESRETEVAGLTVYVVRHAEKQVIDGQDDPGLTPQGEARAQALATTLDGEDVVAIISSPFVRTRATVGPLAAAAGIALTEIDGHDFDAIIASIRAHTSGAVVVSGHSDTVPAILSALGVSESIAIESDDYGDLFVVRPSAEGVSLERRRFGD